MSDNYKTRQFSIQIFFALAALVLIGKASQLQLFDSTFRVKADATVMDQHVLYPSRGLIYDRNGELLVYNNPMYDLMVTFNQIDPKMDTLGFCELLGISKDYFIDALDKPWRSNRYSKSVPFVFLSKISAQTYARFQESLYKFPGFFVQLRNVRGYPFSNAAHLLGNIREVNRDEIKRYEGVYAPGDYIGDNGLEHAYENELRGEKGSKFVLKDNMGREVGPFKDGDKDTDPVSGKDLITSIDISLQSFGEELMENKIGSIVAIEPSTGQILSMISSPTYDPNLLTINQNRGANYAKLARDSLKPFFDRSVMAQYPPGSLFKPVVALVAMQEGVLAPNRGINCSGAYYHLGMRLTGCHNHPYCYDVNTAIQHSCNAYFVTVFREIIDKHGFFNPQEGLDIFNGYLDKFGIGHPLGLDFPREQKGNYPSSGFYNKWFKGQKWNSIWIRSLAIGQGEMLMTNLQMANLAAIMANRGYYYTPHMVTGFIQEDGTISEKYTQQNFVGINQEHFEPVIDGLEQVVAAGTARSAYLWDIAICGKTGTAENPHGEDHSIFFGFAPKENPQIAVAVYVENAGFGGTYAAPIASLMIEKYLIGEIRPFREYLHNKIKTANLIDLP